jgi:hypothetical protein
MLSGGGGDGRMHLSGMMPPSPDAAAHRVVERAI